MRERSADTNARFDFRTIGLIAGREISQRLRSRAFHLVTALVALCAFAIVMVPHWFQSSSSHTRVVVEVTDADSPVTSVIRQQLTAAGFDVTVSATPRSTDLLNSGEADAVLGADGILAVSSETTPDARAAITAIALQASMTAPVHESENLPQALQRSNAIKIVPVATTANRGIATGGLVLLMIAILFGGGAVGAAVVEEKEGKLVELLLPSVDPADILAGKIIGVGALTLLQVTVAASGAVAGLMLSGGGLTPTPWPIAASALGWLLMGFVLYASTYAGAGALARRQEDVPTISIPITMLIAAGYLASVLALDQPRSTVFQVLSLLPPFSPFLMPTRLAVGDLMWWEQPLAFVLSLLAVLMTLRLSGRLYRRSILGFQQPASSPEPRHRRPRTPKPAIARFAALGATGKVRP